MLFFLTSASVVYRCYLFYHENANESIAFGECIEIRLSLKVLLCYAGGQAQAVLARLVCQKARRAAAVNGAKRSS